MQNYHNFTTYKPEDACPEWAVWLRDEDGTDWYACQSTFRTDTVKVAYRESDGVIVSMSKDVSALCPYGLSVAEVSEWPDGADITGGWIFDGERVVARTLTPEEWCSKAELQRSALISEARETISLWQSELLLGIISDENRESLTEWIAYIKLLQSVDLSGVTDEVSYNGIAWPDKPAVTM